MIPPVDRMKRQFLGRLIAVVIVVLIIPTIGIMMLLATMHNDQFIKDSEQYHQNVADKYSALLDKRIRELNMIAASISVDSKKASSKFYQGTEAISEDPYQIYLATNELKQAYSVENVTEWGVYFYDTGRIVAPGSAYSFEHYLLAGMAYYGDDQKIATFFSEQNYSYLTVNVCKGVNVAGDTEQMLVGVCTTLGKDKDRVMVFFGISPQNLMDTLVITEDEGVACYLFGGDKDTALLCGGKNPENYLGAVLRGEEYRDNDGVKHKVLYSSESNVTELTIATYVTETSVQSQLFEQVRVGRRVLLLGMGTVAVLSILAIWLAYKPIYTLMKDLDFSEGSEMNAIRTILNDRHTRITEYEMRVMDLLMDHLLHGVPVSEKSLNHLGINKAFDHYCVIILKDYVPTRVESENIVGKIAATTASRCFVTDWEDGTDTIFVVFMQGDCKDAVVNELTDWLNSLGLDTARLVDGKTVDQLDLIQNSFRSCMAKNKRHETFEEGNPEQSEEGTVEKHVKLKNDVLQYIDIHFREQDLSQTKMADLFGVSTYTLSRLFKNEVGVGFAEYVVAKRIAYATERLLSTDDSVGEICTDAGFSSINHFSKTFKLYKGCSPSQFRKQE